MLASPAHRTSRFDGPRRSGKAAPGKHGKARPEAAIICCKGTYEEAPGPGEHLAVAYWAVGHPSGPACRATQAGEHAPMA